MEIEISDGFFMYLLLHNSLLPLKQFNVRRSFVLGDNDKNTTILKQ